MERFSQVVPLTKRFLKEQVQVNPRKRLITDPVVQSVPSRTRTRPHQGSMDRPVINLGVTLETVRFWGQKRERKGEGTGTIPRPSSESDPSCGSRSRRRRVGRTGDPFSEKS